MSRDGEREGGRTGTYLKLADFPRLAPNEGAPVRVQLDGEAALLDQSAIGSGCVESGDACPSGAQTLGKRALRGEFHLRERRREGGRKGGRVRCGCGD